MKRIDHFIVAGAVGVAALYALLVMTVGVSFYRPVPLDNDPLRNSVGVTSLSSNGLILAGGKILVMEDYRAEFLERELRESDDRVELDPLDSGFATVFVKKKRFICGTHAPRVVLPLLRHEYPAYERQLLGLGRLR